MRKPKKRHSLRMKMMLINISITLASFILCGLMFVMAVSLQVSKYVQHDLDFFLTEMGDNLGTKLKYMEEVILKVRSSEDMLDYLTEIPQEEGVPRISGEFGRTVDINSTGNQGDGDGPIVDKVYLFCEDGSYLNNFYYALVYSQISESDAVFRQVYQSYCQQKDGTQRFHSYLSSDNGRTYMVFPVLDDGLEEKGTLIFEINLPAIEKVMEAMANYEDSFWMLYSPQAAMCGNNTEAAQTVLKETEGSRQYQPYVCGVNGRQYRTYRTELCLDMQVVLGIPENQTWVILYDSLDFYIIGIIVILAALLFGFVFFTYKLTKPIEEVTRKLKQVQGGDFETKLPDYEHKEFHEISQVFNQMTEDINHLVKQVYEKQISIKEMELKFLQTQMNPHFMFNVLNAIALQARIDGNEDICKQISTFSQLIQAKIYRSDTEKVRISQELEYAKYYLEIQKFRYGERLSYHITILDESVLMLYLPKLCIQLIVENAVVHGLEPKTGDGTVEIMITRTEEDVFIDIMDDGVGFGIEGEISFPIQKEQPDASHNHVGLNNVHHIIKLMYGEKYGLRISSCAGEKTRVRIWIPADHPPLTGSVQPLSTERF